MSKSSASLFFLFIALGCTQRKAPVSTSKPSTSEDTIYIEDLKDPNDPRHQWLKEISQLDLHKKIVLRSEPPWLLHAPEWKVWLQHAHPKGAVILLLLPTGQLKTESNEEIASQLALLRAFVGKTREGNYLHLSPSLSQTELVGAEVGAKNSTQQHATSSTKLSFVEISNPYQDSLLFATCDYVRRWIKTRQILENISPPQSHPSANFECRLVWGKNSISEAGLTLARLPLPFTIGTTGSMPFLTIDDALNPALLTKLFASP